MNKTTYQPPSTHPTTTLVSAGNELRLLVEMTKTLRLNEVPSFARLVRNIVVSRNIHAAQNVINCLAPAYHQQIVKPDPFLSVAGDLDGEILLGTTPSGKRVGLNRMDLVRHIFISGQSGTGKSALIKSLVLQCQQAGIPLLHFDRKADLAHLAPQLDTIRWQNDRDNPLLPPHPAVNIYEYRNDIAKMFAEMMQFWQRGLSIFLLGLDMLYKKFAVYDRWPSWDWAEPFPTLMDLALLFKSSGFRKQIKGQGMESVHSIIDKLDALIIELEPIVACRRGYDLTRFVTERRAVNYLVDGISLDYQNFLIVGKLLKFAHFLKATAARGVLNLFVAFDEAKSLFNKANENLFVIKDLISRIREWGLALATADQIPSEISQFLFSNIGTLVAFRHSDGYDLQRLRYSAGATIQQSLENYNLQPGDAIVRLTRCPDLIKITVPFTPTEKFIDPDRLDAVMSARLEELQKDVISYAPTSSEDKRSSFTQHERRFLEAIAQDFDRPAYQIYEQLELSSSAGYRLKERLKHDGFISQVTTNLGAGGKQATYLLPNPILFDELGIALLQGRGGLLHCHFQGKLKVAAEEKGYTAVIEESVDGTPNGADIGLTKGKTRIAVEICITSKPRQELDHIRSRLSSGYSLVIVAFVHRRVLASTLRLARTQLNKDQFLKAKFCVINEVVSLL